MHYIDQHWITLNTAKEVLLLSCSDVCTEMKSLVILKWPKQQQMIGIAVRAIHCILGSDYEETQKRETRRRETLNKIPARHLALHSGSDYEETQKRGTLDRILAFGIAFGPRLVWGNNEEKHRKKETLDRILCSKAFGIAFWLRRSNWLVRLQEWVHVEARSAGLPPNCDLYVFTSRAGNISLAPIHFPPYLSALIPETPGRFPEIRSPSPDIC